MDNKEKEQIDLWLATHLEDRVKVRSTNFNFEYWALSVKNMTDEELGRMTREYLELCMNRNPETVKPATFPSTEALKGLAKANQARISQSERGLKSWETRRNNAKNKPAKRQANR